MREMSDRCDIINDKGEIISNVADRRMDFHFNALLDIIADWRRNKTVDSDVNLLGNVCHNKCIV